MAVSKRVRNTVIVSCILLIAGATAAFLALRSKEGGEAEPTVQARQVSAESIQLRNIERIVSAQGYVVSRRTLPIHARVGGEVVYSLEAIRPGTRVARGDVLVSIDSGEIANEVQLAETHLLRGLAQLLANLETQDPMNIGAKWTAFRTALISGSVPPFPSIETDRERLVVSNYGIIESYHQLVHSGRTLSYHNVVAPFSGVILSGERYVGSTVFSGEELLTLIDPYNLEVSISLTREELLYLTDSRETTVTIHPVDADTPTAVGRIDRTGGFVERDTQMVNAFIRFENERRILDFLPGSYVEVELSGDPIHNALVIPRGLINEDGTLNFIVEGKLAKHAIDVVGFRGDDVVVTGPRLTDGMQLVTTTIQIPVEGMALTTEAGGIAD